MINRVVDDLRRPAGGWTTGLLTLAGAFASGTLVLAGLWPAPRWTGTATMLALLFAHMLWGAAGYYPRRVA